MAIGNLFQGSARGSVGDVVFSRLDGKQVSRVRNRNPRNPRTDSQLIQRAIMATVSNAYKAGRAIFDHSFQGFSSGADSQAYFLRVNAKRLRALLAGDVQSTPNAFSATSVIAPGVSTIVPNSYLVSRGDLTQPLFNVVGGLYDFGPTLYKAGLSDGTPITTLLRQLRVREGDIFTIVFLSVAPLSYLYTVGVLDETNLPNTVMEGVFDYVQLEVKSLDSIPDTVTIGTAKNSDVFNVFSTNSYDAASTRLSATPYQIVSYQGSQNVYYGVIRSRKDSPLRSTCVLVPGGVSSSGHSWGLTYDYLLEAWRNGAQTVGNSDLVLEGSNF